MRVILETEMFQWKLAKSVNPILLIVVSITKTYFLCYYVILLQSLTEILKEHSKLVSKVYLSNLFLDKNHMPQNLREDYVY